MNRSGSGRWGFSLIEVATAVAIVAVALVVILGLLGGLARRAGETQDRHVTAGLAGAVTEAVRQRAEVRGWESLVAEAADQGADEGGIRFVVARDGTDLRDLGADASSTREQYFIVVARRATAGALAVAPESPVLPLIVTVSWPFRPAPAGAGVEVPQGERHRLQFNVAINR